MRRSEAWRRKSEVLRSFPGVGKVFCTIRMLPAFASIDECEA
jgi:hypothetical protein